MSSGETHLPEGFEDAEGFDDEGFDIDAILRASEQGTDPDAEIVAAAPAQAQKAERVKRPKKHRAPKVRAPKVGAVALVPKPSGKLHISERQDEPIGDVIGHFSYTGETDKEGNPVKRRLVLPGILRVLSLPAAVSPIRKHRNYHRTQVNEHRTLRNEMNTLVAKDSLVKQHGPVNKLRHGRDSRKDVYIYPSALRRRILMSRATAKTGEVVQKHGLRVAGAAIVGAAALNVVNNTFEPDWSDLGERMPLAGTINSMFDKGPERDPVPDQLSGANTDATAGGGSLSDLLADQPTAEALPPHISNDGTIRCTGWLPKGIIFPSERQLVTMTELTGEPFREIMPPERAQAFWDEIANLEQKPKDCEGLLEPLAPPQP